MRVDLSAEAIAARLAEAARAARLDPALRLEAKIGLSAAEIARRIHTVSELRDVCLRLADVGARYRKENAG